MLDIRIRVLGLWLLIAALVGCANLVDNQASAPPLVILSGEEAEQALYRFIKAQNRASRRYKAKTKKRGLLLEEVIVTAQSVSTPLANAPSEISGDESITNNQQAGVDEGGIVKRYLDYLIILRQGRLYVVRTEPIMETVLSIPVQQAIDPYESWYDELLINGDQLMVLGYSPDWEATEIQRFNIDPDGQLSHRDTYLIRSRDYYDADNYGFRLVDGQLVFLMRDWPPDFELSEGRSRLQLPKMMRLTLDSKLVEPRPLFATHDIVLPALISPESNLTSIVRCPLNQFELGCQATSVVSSFHSEHYITNRYAYLWQSGGVYGSQWRGMNRARYRDLLQRDIQGRNDDSVLYRIPLLSQEPVGALAVRGQPHDRFSFSQQVDHLLVLAERELIDTDLENKNELKGTHLYTLVIPLSVFSVSQQLRPLPDHLYYALDADEGVYGVEANRFIGNLLVVAWWGEGEDTWITLADPIQNKTLGSVALDYEVQQIHPLDQAVLILGSRWSWRPNNSGDVAAIVSTIKIGPQPPEITSQIEDFESEHSEGRSHSFYYRPLSDGQGIVAHALSRYTKQDFSHITDGVYHELEPVLSMRYLKVDTEAQLTEVGRLEGDAREIWRNDEQCQTSCYDWYGATRPIFIGERIFALLKDELIEGRLINDTVVEIYRLNYTAQ